MKKNELQAIDFLLKTNKYHLSFKLIEEDKVPKKHQCGYKRYYKFTIKDSRKEIVDYYYTPYGAIPTKAELFFTKNHGHRLFEE